jgi:hypothetical protein
MVSDASMLGSPGDHQKGDVRFDDGCHASGLGIVRTC